MKLHFLQKSLLSFVFLLTGISIGYANFNLSTISGKVYDGFVIIASGDTLQGKVQMLSPTLNQVKIKFIDESGKKQLYKAKELQAYAFQVKVWDHTKKESIYKWIHYTKKTVEIPPIPFSSTEVLVQQELIGKISIYNYYRELRAEQTMEHIVYLEKEGKMYVVDKVNYKNILRSLMKDAPFLSDKVGTKGYTYKFLDESIKEYNQGLMENVSASN